MLTPDQKKRIITSPEFKAIIKKPTAPMATSTGMSLMERAKVLKGKDTMNQAGDVISKLKTNLETKYSKGEIGGDVKERSDRIKKEGAEKIFGDFNAGIPKVREMAKEAIIGLPREMARPFVSFIKGLQGIVPGGKTGEEKTTLPIIGEVKPYSELGSGEAALNALSIIPTTGKVAKEVGDEVMKPRIREAAKLKIDDLVGKITQGDKASIEGAKRALKEIDTTGVKSFSQLREVANKNISVAVKAQDKFFDATKKAIKEDELVTKIGSKTTNFVRKGIDNLKEYYESTENIKKLDWIEGVEKKLAGKGLTAKEINVVARKYSADMPSAFAPKTGAPLTSVNKIAFENVRKGLKDVSRGLMPDESTKILDSHISDLYTLKRTAENMEKAVLKLNNKIKKRGVLEKMGRGAGRIVDASTGGLVRSFFSSFLPSNIGNKVMNSVDIEADLAKNLKKIVELNKKVDSMSDKQIIDEISKLLSVIKE